MPLRSGFVTHRAYVYVGERGRASSPNGTESECFRTPLWALYVAVDICVILWVEYSDYLPFSFSSICLKRTSVSQRHRRGAHPTSFSNSSLRVCWHAPLPRTESSMQSFGSRRPLRTRNDLSHPGCGYTTAIADPCDAARAWWEQMGGGLAMWLSRKRRSRLHYWIQTSTYRLQLVVCLPMLTLALRSLASQPGGLPTTG